MAIIDDLQRASDELDQLMADVRQGAPFGRHDLRHADHEERAQAVARAVLAPFRGPSARPVCPPIGRVGSAVVY